MLVNFEGSYVDTPGRERIWRSGGRVVDLRKSVESSGGRVGWLNSKVCLVV